MQNLIYAMAQLQHPLSRSGVKSEICQINMDESVPELEQREFFSLFRTFHTFPHTEGKPTSSDGYAPGFFKLP